MAEKINRMFSKIYKKYDLMNHLFSFNLDKSWRNETAKDAVISKKEYVVLDIASGTGDLAIETNRVANLNSKKIRIYAYDFNKDMLAIAKDKLIKKGIKNITIEIGSAYRITHPKNSIDVITSGFALRSFANSNNGNMREFLSESYRVMKSGGRIVLLDMAMPENKMQIAFFNTYSIFMLAIGSLVDKETYTWLVKTIKDFDKKELVKMMNVVGFRNIKIRSLKSGIAFVVTAEK